MKSSIDTSPPPIIRTYQPGDEVGINDSFNRVFGLSRALWEWQHKFQSTDNEAPFISIAVQPATEKQAEIVLAQFAALPLRMQCKDTPVLGAQGVDAYSLPSIRTTRLYPRTVEHFFTRFVEPGPVDLVYGFAGTRNTELLVRHHGFTAQQQAPLHVREGWPLRSRLPDLPSSYRIHHGFDAERHDTLWQRSRARYPFCTIRDARHYVKRFPETNSPYHFLTCTRHGVPHAALVARELHGGLSVVDWLWDGVHTRAIDLLDRALHHTFPKLQQHQTWLGGDPALEAHLHRRGWRTGELSHPNFLIMRWRKHAPSAMIECASQPYLTMADADLA